jgi:NADH-quinone oxidoreductase subunit G
VLPLHHIFGSEELSAKAAPVASRIPEAHVVISVADSLRLGLDENSRVSLSVDATSVRLPIRISPFIRQGAVGVPVGLQGVPVLPAEAWVRVSGAGA